MKRFSKLVVDVLVDEEALGRDAALAVVDAARLDGMGDGFVEVGGGEDDEGVGAAEFEHGLLDEPSGLGGDGAAGGLGTGDGDGGNAAVGEEAFDLAGLDEEGLEAAAGEAGAADEGLDLESALGDIGGVLEQGDVAGHEGGSGEAEDMPEGEVPGHDGEDDADGVIADVALGVAGGDVFGGEDARCVLGVVAAGGSALGDFLARGGKRFAHLGGHERGEIVDIGFEDRGEATHPEDALVERFAGVRFGSVGRDGELGVDRVRCECVEAAE